MVNPVLVNDLRRSLFRRKPVNAVAITAVAILLLTLVAETAMNLGVMSQMRYIPLWNLPDLMLPIVVPAFAAGSFAKEHEQRTWDDLRLTMLGAWEIIRGKFLACLLPTVIAITVMFPPFAMLLMLQGVNWSLNFGPWVPILLIKFFASAFFYISLVMLCSCFFSNARTALVASYVLLAAYGIANFVIWEIAVASLYDLFIGVDPGSAMYRALHRGFGNNSEEATFSLGPIEQAHIYQSLAFGMISLIFLRDRMRKRA